MFERSSNSNSLGNLPLLFLQSPFDFSIPELESHPRATRPRSPPVSAMSKEKGGAHLEIAPLDASVENSLSICSNFNEEQ